MSTILYVILSLLVLGLCILIHELGHYFAARATGLAVVELAIGMGPKLFGWSRNGTDYSVRAFPIGGYCAFVGESPEDEAEDPRNINLQPAWKRLVTTAAGPLMNFVLALVLAVVLMAAIGEYVVVNRVDAITENSPAAAAGLEKGDRITAVNGQECEEAAQISEVIGQTGDEDVTLTVERDGETFETVVSKQYDEESGRYLMGFSLGIDNVRTGFPNAVKNSVSYCAKTFKTMLETLGQIFTQKEVLDELAGPVGTVSVMTQYAEESFAQSAREGVTTMLNLAVIITMNLGIVNLLPLPALDGGRLVLLAVETVCGKHLSRKAEAIVHFVGLILLLGLSLLLTGRDILRLFGVNL